MLLFVGLQEQLSIGFLELDEDLAVRLPVGRTPSGYWLVFSYSNWWFHVSLFSQLLMLLSWAMVLCDFILI